MLNHSAVCIQCGEFKPKALGACGACGFCPSSEEDQARSLMLSQSFDAGEMVIGLAPDELQRAAHAIQKGESYFLKPQDIAEVMKLHASARTLTPLRLAIDLVRWLAPPLLFLVAIFWFFVRK